MQAHVVIQGIGLEAGVARIPSRAERIAAGDAAIAGVESAPARDEPRRKGALRHLVGGVPGVVIGLCREVERAQAVAQRPRQLAHVFGQIPGPVIVFDGQAIEQVAAADGGVVRDHGAAIAELADFGLGDAEGQRVEIADVEGPGGAEIADLGIIRPLAVIHALDEFGNGEVEVGIALAMAVADHVDRQAVDADRQVGAVIEVEAAQVILVGLAAARMLADDDAGDIFHDLAGAQQRAQRQVGGADRAFVGRCGDAGEIGAAAQHLHGFGGLGEGGHGQKHGGGGEKTRFH